MDYRQNSSANGPGRKSPSSARRQSRPSGSSPRSAQSRSRQQASSRRRAEVPFADETTSAVRSVSSRPASGAPARQSSRPSYEQMRASRQAAQAASQGQRQRDAAGRDASGRGRRQSSLRRQVVSNMGYEPGQSSRPSSNSSGNPIQEGFSLGIDAGSGKDTAWRSRSRRGVPSAPDRDWRPIIGAAIGIVLAVVIISVIFGH